MTTEVVTNGAKTGYLGRVTIFSLMLTIACCLVVGLGLGLGLYSVCGWLVVVHTYLFYFRLSASHCLLKQLKPVKRQSSALGPFDTCVHGDIIISGSKL